MSIPSTELTLPRAGLLVLAEAKSEVLYMNKEAKALCDELSSLEGSNSALPGAVRSVVAMLGGPSQKTAAEVVWGDAQPSIVMQAFAIEQGPEVEKSLVIVILERVGIGRLGHWSQKETDQLFTTREKEVLAWLRKGYTNKEIGLELQISEQTVKKHVSHILLKSRTPNRVGVLARLIGAVA